MTLDLYLQIDLVIPTVHLIDQVNQVYKVIYWVISYKTFLSPLMKNIFLILYTRFPNANNYRNHNKRKANSVLSKRPFSDLEKTQK